MNILRPKRLIYPTDVSIYGARHPDWRKVRNEHIEKYPYCAVCGHTKDLQAHHILPFHLFPDHELEPDNLITLGIKCPSGNHHFLFGHYCNWMKYNLAIKHDASRFLFNISNIQHHWEDIHE